MNSGQTPSPQKDSGEPFSWKLRPTLQLKIKANWLILGMNSGQPAPWKDSGEPFCWILRPTLQLKIKANSWNEFRPTPLHPQKDSGEPFSWKLRPTLQLKIEANSWNEFQWTPPERFKWTLQLKLKANSSTKNSGQLLEWIQTNPSPQESLGEPFSWILRPTLQLKIQTNSSTEN